MPVQRKNTKESEYHWAREWEFADAHASTHTFVEKAISRGPKEIACAFTASFLVSPLVSIIDKTIVQDVPSTSAFMRALGGQTREMFMNPKTFLTSKSFVLTFAVYFGTYATANISELLLDVSKVTDDVERKTYKVSAASVANISLLAWRDSIFAREFSNGPPKPTPYRTIGLFAARDSATMYSTFYLAPKAAVYLHDNHGWERNVAELSMALGIPMVTQVITAPLHIHAMDYYNNPASTSMSERMSAISKQFNSVSFARGLRILPAFGIGSFSNNKFRELFIQQENEDLLLKRRVTNFITNRLTRPAPVNN